MHLDQTFVIKTNDKFIQHLNFENQLARTFDQAHALVNLDEFFYLPILVLIQKISLADLLDDICLESSIATFGQSTLHNF